MRGGRARPLLPLREWQLALPLALFFVAFFLAPLIVLGAVSLLEAPNERTLSVAQYARFLGDRFSLAVLLETVLLGLKATLVCLLFGIPFAWVCSRARPSVQSLLVFVVVLPLLTSVVVRTFAWIVILGRQGVFNKVLQSAGLIEEPIRLLYSEVGVVTVLAQVQLPLMVLPLLTSMQRIDPNLLDASAALGAGRWRTFTRVVLPLSVPGMIAGSILTFAACTTAFVTQTLIGGARLLYMPLYIYQQATGANNWPFAAAMSILLLVAVLAVVFLLGLLSRLGRGSSHG